VVLHGTYEQSQTDIGDGASIGHGAIIHGARIGAQVLIGMGAVVMDGADIGTGAVIAAGAVVLAGTVVPARTLWAGVPARQVGPVKPELAERLAATSDRYVEYADWFRSGGAD
jgi:carbonic anhydrase/acetyltransferase-like protein (isoleucine patch superfamily)